MIKGPKKDNLPDGFSYVSESYIVYGLTESTLLAKIRIFYLLAYISMCNCALMVKNERLAPPGSLKDFISSGLVFPSIPKRF